MGMPRTPVASAWRGAGVSGSTPACRALAARTLVCRRGARLPNVSARLFSVRVVDRGIRGARLLAGSRRRTLAPSRALHTFGPCTHALARAHTARAPHSPRGVVLPKPTARAWLVPGPPASPRSIAPAFALPPAFAARPPLLTPCCCGTARPGGRAAAGSPGRSDMPLRCSGLSSSGSRASGARRDPASSRFRRRGTSCGCCRGAQRGAWLCPRQRRRGPAERPRLTSRSQMDQAVAVEDYKQAAKVRDQYKVGSQARCRRAVPGEPRRRAGRSGAPSQPARAPRNALSLACRPGHQGGPAAPVAVHIHAAGGAGQGLGGGQAAGHQEPG
jgi:hypothetical protein